MNEIITFLGSSLDGEMDLGNIQINHQEINTLNQKFKDLASFSTISILPPKKQSQIWTVKKEYIDRTVRDRERILDAFVNAFGEYAGTKFSINMYNEHAMKSGTDSAAITYIEIKRESDGQIFLGAGVSSSVTKSSVRAIISAYNRMIKE